MEVQLLYAEVNETAAELDATANLLNVRVSSEVSALNASLTDTRDEVSNITVRIQSLDTSIDERFSLANLLVLNLRDNIRMLATESHTNITELERDISEALVVSLNVLKEETQSNISTLATALDHRIAKTALSTNANLASLASSFFNSLNQVNSSFLSELQKVSSTTAGNLQTALQELSGELFVLYDYSNTSLAEVKVRLDTVILSLNLTAEVSSSAIEEFQATNDATVALVHDVQTNLTSLVAANLELTQAALDSSTESIGNAIGTRIAALEVHTRENLTRLEDDMFSELQRVKNGSRTALAALRVDTEDSIETLRNDTDINITQSQTALHQVISQINSTIQDTITTFTMQQETTLNELSEATKSNITSLRAQLSALESNLISTSEEVGNIAAIQVSTTDKIDTFNSSVRDLNSQLATAVEQLQSTLHAHMNTSLDLYSDCVEETSECNLSPSIADYQGNCNTDPLSINVQVSVWLVGREEREKGRMGSEAFYT